MYLELNLTLEDLLLTPGLNPQYILQLNVVHPPLIHHSTKQQFSTNFNLFMYNLIALSISGTKQLAANAHLHF